MLTIFPFSITAVPIDILDNEEVVEIANTWGTNGIKYVPLVLTPGVNALYPDPLLPILTDVIVPPAEIIAVPPAATSG